MARFCLTAGELVGREKGQTLESVIERLCSFHLEVSRARLDVFVGSLLAGRGASRSPELPPSLEVALLLCLPYLSSSSLARSLKFMYCCH